jgi:2',3'-cyclic-nucleotide 2'-phosphodiesterase (5'-nucleotidase family)
MRLEPQVGEHSVTVRACDAAQCASLEVPLHVAGDACAAACDDGNPCTDDTADAGGFCSSTPVADGSLCSAGNFRVKVLGSNDFHGQLETGRVVAGRPVGGAAVLASYLKSAQAGIEGQTIIVHAGDHVGASPPASALLQDEPSISFLNLLANESCSAADRLNPACNVVGTVGNHEFDEGMNELLRLLSGGNFATGAFLEDPFPGALFPYVSANVIERATNQPLLRPFVVKELHGVKLGVIGAVLKQTPTIVTPSGVAGLTFLDEADAINAQAAALKQTASYTVTCNNFLAGGGDNFLAFKEGSNPIGGPVDLDALIEYVEHLGSVVVPAGPRIFTL